MFNIGLNGLKLNIWIKDGQIYISTKFKENPRTLKILINSMHLYEIFYPMVVKMINPYLINP